MYIYYVIFYQALSVSYCRNITKYLYKPYYEFQKCRTFKPFIKRTNNLKIFYNTEDFSSSRNMFPSSPVVNQSSPSYIFYFNIYFFRKF